MARAISALLCLWAVLLVGCASPEQKAARHLQRGVSLIAAKEYARAVLELKNAARLSPRDPEAHYQLGLGYLATQDYRSAYQSFRRATELNPKHAAAQMKVAELLSLTDQEDLLREAMSRVTEAYGTTPNDSQAYSLLALAEWKLGQHEEAARRLEDALEKFPTDLQVSVALARMKLGKKDFAGAEEVLSQAVSHAPQAAMPLVAIARLHMVIGKLEKAEQELTRALQLDSKSAPALASLAQIQSATGRTSDAEQTYRQLVALPDKRYQTAHAAFLYRTGKRDAAVSEFETLAKSQPDDRALRTALVTAYLGLGRVSDAENVLAGALQRNSKDIEALLQRAELHLRAGKVELAERELSTVIHMDASSAMAHFLMATVHQARGVSKQRRQELDEALRLGPGLLPVRLAMAAFYLESKQPAAALQILDAAPAEQKGLLQWLLGHNAALLVAGNLEEAKAGIARALLAGRYPEVLEQSAALRLMQRDPAGARADLDEILKRVPPNPQLADLLMATYAAQRDIPKGLARLLQMAAANPKSGLDMAVGNWSLQSGDTVGAQKAFEAAVAADPHSSAPNLALAGIDIAAGRQDAARGRLGTVLAAEPSNVQAHLLLAKSEQSAGNPDAAMANYRTILANDRSNVPALNNLAYLLAETNADEALGLAQQAAELAPNHPAVQDTLGWVYYRKGMYGRAVQHLRIAVDREGTPRRQFHLGMAYMKTGDRLTGAKLVSEALEKEPALTKTEKGW